MPRQAVYDDYDRHAPPRWIDVPDAPVRQAPQAPPKPAPLEGTAARALYDHDQETAAKTARKAQLEESDILGDKKAQRELAALEKWLKFAPARRETLVQAVREDKLRAVDVDDRQTQERQQQRAQALAEANARLKAARAALVAAEREAQRCQAEMLNSAWDNKAIYQRYAELGQTDAQIAHRRGQNTRHEKGQSK